jgi:glycosyltransferase involved in cell wall biosynthesis
LKILIITYYWPPSGGSGVQRWLKFVKYLRDFGIEPVVYTLVNPTYAIEDQSLAAQIPEGIEVLRQPIFEPNAIFSFLGKKNKKQSSGFLNPNPSFIGKVMQYIRANYFIPDARKFWVNPSVKYLKSYIEDHDIKAVISTGPPHSMHLIGLKLKEKLGVKWIADFRDPWTEIDYFHQLPLTKKSISKHLSMEEQVVSKSDAVIVVGNTMKENFKKYSDAIHVITNGFDTEEYQVKDNVLDSKFSITHIGLMNADRNPKVLWKVLKDMCEENPEFKKDLKVQLIGKIADEVSKDIEYFRGENLKQIPYVKHNEARLFQQKSQLLLLAINRVPSARGIITGKIFEYLQANRPILGIGPKDGDAADIIEEGQAGKMIDFDDEVGLKEALTVWYTAFKNKSLQMPHRDIEKYHRRTLTRDLSLLIKETIHNS